ncbi:MAG: hypothetical protein IJZ74_11615 [Clostridia bacterium]|nr:hypothetical protein [Clostridia bacterium]
MADFSTTLKGLWSQSVKAVNKAATGLASATRYKMDEMGGISRRREAIAELGEKVFALSQTGVELPEEVAPLLKEIQELEAGLAELRSDRVAAKAAAAEQAAAEKAARAAEKAAAKAAAAAEKAAAEAESAPVLEVEAAEETDGPIYSSAKPDPEDVPSINVEEEEEAE